MTRQRTTPAILFLILPLFLMLNGCNQTIKNTPVRKTLQDPLKSRAEQYVQANNFQAAAQVYLTEQPGQTPDHQAQSKLSAVAYLIRGRQWDNARSVIDSIDPQMLQNEDANRYHLALARIELAQNEAELALQTLRKVTQPELLPQAGLKYYRLNAAANQAAGNTTTALQQLIWLDGLLADNELRRKNHTTIWQQLSSLPDDELKTLRSQHNQRDAFSGWIELAYQARASRYNASTLQASLQQWRQQFPAHAAEEDIAPELISQAPVSYTQAGNIAVLLPMTGKTARQASAIHDAIMATHKFSGNTQTQIKTYDTSATLSIEEVYQQAVYEGAEFVIGPLLKNNISTLVQSGVVQTPMLALNRIEETVSFSQPVYQFGLDPGNEARQTAERARLDGHQRIVALVPDSAWGDRVLAAFADYWQKSGGELMGVDRYPARTTDFSQYIKRILNLDRSKQRHRNLQHRLGNKLEYQARRRQDVDSVFIVAFPREARQIKPQLDYHHASDLPVYATSHAYSGSPQPGKDRDLNGIRFCDSPWILAADIDKNIQRRLTSSWGKRAYHYQRLFSLGVDAYRLIPWLQTMTDSFNNRDFNGVTGIITLDENRHLQRRLDCAEFKKGHPQLLGTLPIPILDSSPDETMVPGNRLQWSTEP